MRTSGCRTTNCSRNSAWWSPGISGTLVGSSSILALRAAKCSCNVEHIFHTAAKEVREISFSASDAPSLSSSCTIVFSVVLTPLMESPSIAKVSTLSNLQFAISKQSSAESRWRPKTWRRARSGILSSGYFVRSTMASETDSEQRNVLHPSEFFDRSRHEREIARAGSTYRYCSRVFLHLNDRAHRTCRCLAVLSRRLYTELRDPVAHCLWRYTPRSQICYTLKLRDPLRQLRATYNHNKILFFVKNSVPSRSESALSVRMVFSSSTAGWFAWTSSFTSCLIIMAGTDERFLVYLSTRGPGFFQFACNPISSVDLPAWTAASSNVTLHECAVMSFSTWRILIVSTDSACSSADHRAYAKNRIHWTVLR